MKNFCFKAGGILLIIGVIMCFVLRTDIVILFSEPVDIFMDGVEDVDDVKAGLSIESEMYLLMECFGSMETTHKNRAGQTTGTSVDYYYIMPVFVGDTDTYYVAFKVSSKSDDLSMYNKIANDTMAYLYMEQDYFGTYSTDINGGLYKLDDEIYGHMKDWFEETQFFTSDSDINKYVLPYVFKPHQEKGLKTLVGIALGAAILGIVLLVGSLFMDKKYNARRKALSQKGDATVTINGIQYRVSMMEQVDRLIAKGNIEKAKKKLMKDYRASDVEAQQIAENWNNIVGLY
ncbi:MAG: hypothetical protein IJX12_05280 [Lachnospiraceae bacterium]|nr:hypothetical protein [Lachnospiraceae bacterium]